MNQIILWHISRPDKRFTLCEKDAIDSRTWGSNQATFHRIMISSDLLLGNVYLSENESYCLVCKTQLQKEYSDFFKWRTLYEF